MSEREKVLYLHVTKECNLSCKHCFWGLKEKSRKSLTQSQIKTVLRYFHQRYFNSLQITGGEPSLFPQLKQTITLARKEGYSSIGISTNGVLSKILDKLTPLEINNITFGLDGATPKTNDYLREKGHFKKCIRSIKKAVKRGFIVQVVFCLYQKNFREIKKIITLLDHLKVFRLSFNYISPTGNAKKNQKLLLSPLQWINSTEIIEKIKTKNLSLRFPIRFVYSNKKNLFTKQQCSLKKSSQVFVSPDGEIYSCCLLVGEPNCFEAKIIGKKIAVKQKYLKNNKTEDFNCPAPEFSRIKRYKNIVPVCINQRKIINPRT